jgi:rRNA biogenesis protein RRP5
VRPSGKDRYSDLVILSLSLSKSRDVCCFSLSFLPSFFRSFLVPSFRCRACLASVHLHVCVVVFSLLVIVFFCLSAPAPLPSRSFSLQDHEETVEELERLVAGSPQSSYLWIRFAAHLTGAGDLDRARAIMERALKAVPAERENERMNLWVAWLNLENVYGSPKEVSGVFDRANRQVDSLKLHLQLAEIYTSGKQWEEATQLFKVITRKFRQSRKAWVCYATYLMCSHEPKQPDQARSLLQPAMRALPRRKHIRTVVRFARLEYRSGDAERGSTMMEGLVSTHPKRLDLWTIFLDLQTSRLQRATASHLVEQQTLAVRSLYERVCHLSLSLKKMKYVFKRYLQFEQKYGDRASAQRVKEEAKAFLESRLAD